MRNVGDDDAKTHVEMTLDGQHVQVLDWRQNPGSTPFWTWRWRFDMPNAAGYTLRFFHDCDAGCLAWTQARIDQPAANAALQVERAPTKLGVVWPDPNRDWHNRVAWAVELTYAAQPYEGYTADDLAWRVHRNARAGLRTLVRVDFDKGQTVPPTGDYLALERYVQYAARLARDARLRDAYAFIIGSGFNERNSNTQSPDRPVTPEWYARVFNGYGESVANTHNVVQAMRAAPPDVRILAGPVRPWNSDQDGVRKHTIDAPWLNYMNTLAAAIDESARSKAAVGVPLVAPDGFALNAPGQPDAPELEASQATEEPLTDLKRAEWNGAQAGFRVYQDWLSIVNAYTTTRGLPVYINSTNTFTPEQNMSPAQNYPQGWLTSALKVVNDEPQIQALCWFMDSLPDDSNWDPFSLSKRQGKLAEADDEFGELLRR